MAKRKSGQNVWTERRLLKSKAFFALRTAAAHKVLAIFWTKRQFEQIGRRGKEQWDIVNNGMIVFTYKEARRLGISDGAFRTAIDELCEKGFIDIAATGMGVHKATNLYFISDRWRKYGTLEYEKPKPRPKGPINRGFQKGNRYGRNSRKEKS
jgi:hypothetical protein